MESQSAADYLREKIAKLKDSQTSLESSMANMQMIHDAQELEIEALEGALKKLPVAANESIKPTFGDSETNLKDVGFRDAVRYVLAFAKKGMKPKDIAEELLAQGYQYSGTVHIGTRISNELYRMRKSGSVRKRGGLYYAAKEDDS